MVTHLPRLQRAGWSPHRDPPSNMALQRTRRPRIRSGRSLSVTRPSR
jgi:hypothetical protein